MLICVCFTFVLVSCAVSQHSDDQVSVHNSKQAEMSNQGTASKPSPNYQPKTGDVVAYTLSRKAFQEFLLQPSVDVLSAKCDYLSVFRKYREGNVQQEVFGPEGVKKEVCVSGYFRIGNWPVYLEFIDFMNNEDNFRQILLEHNIHDELLSYTAIAHKNYDDSEPRKPGTMPKMCIWLHTNNGDYFLESNAYLYADPHDTNFLYDFYDLNKYSQKYGGN